jgi:hypothetical protein
MSKNAKENIIQNDIMFKSNVFRLKSIKVTEAETF